MLFTNSRQASVLKARRRGRGPRAEVLEGRELLSGIVNGGFETGDLTGWSVLGEPRTGGSFYAVPPAQGVAQAQIRGADFTSNYNSARVEAFLGLPSGALSNTGRGTATEGGAIKQVFTGNAGDVLQFKWDFMTMERNPLDYGYVVINGRLTVLADSSATNIYLPPNPDGNPFHTGYRTYQYILPATGTYTVGFGAQNVMHPYQDPMLLVDDVQLLPGDVGDTTATARDTALALGGTFALDTAIGDGPFGTRDVDLYRFTAAAGATLTASTALPPGGRSMDTVLRLFDSTGRQLSLNDDYGGTLYSRLTYTFTAAGTYYVGVSGYPSVSYDPNVAGSGAVGGTGDYRLSLNLVVPYGITNGSFESGMTSWSVIGYPYAGNASFGVTPTAGSSLALVRGGTTTNLDNRPQIESFLGLAPDALKGLGVAEGGAIKQTFAGNAGDVVAFDWNFLIVAHQGDLAFVTVNDKVFPLANDATQPFSNADGYRYQTGLKRFTYTLPASGVYTIGIGSANYVGSASPYDGKYYEDPFLAVDNVRLLPVANPGPLGTDTLVNTYTPDVQAGARVATDAAGNYVVTWASNGQDGSGWGIFGQRYDKDGRRLGGEFPINTVTIGNQNDMALAMNPAGDFIVVWSGNGPGDSDGVFARRFGRDGRALDSREFLVNETTAARQGAPSVAMDGSGNFVVSWSGDRAPYGSEIYARWFDGAGRPSAQAPHEVSVNAANPTRQDWPMVALAASGEALIGWSSVAQDGDDFGVYARRYTAPGVADGPEVRVNDTTKGFQFLTSAAADAQGNSMLAWTSYDAPTSPSRGIYTKRYDAGSKTWSTESRVNTTTGPDMGNPVVAMSPAGDAVIAWEERNTDGSGFGVFAQRYDPAGNKLGQEFRVNDTTANDQLNPGVAMTSATSYVVAWRGNGPGDSSGIFARRFGAAPGISPVNPASSASPTIAVPVPVATVPAATQAYSRSTASGATGAAPIDPILAIDPASVQAIDSLLTDSLSTPAGLYDGLEIRGISLRFRRKPLA